MDAQAEVARIDKLLTLTASSSSSSLPWSLDFSLLFRSCFWIPHCSLMVGRDNILGFLDVLLIVLTCWCMFPRASLSRYLNMNDLLFVLQIFVVYLVRMANILRMIVSWFSMRYVCYLSGHECDFDLLLTLFFSSCCDVKRGKIWCCVTLWMQVWNSWYNISLSS